MKAFLIGMLVLVALEFTGSLLDAAREMKEPYYVWAFTPTRFVVQVLTLLFASILGIWAVGLLLVN